MASDFTELLIWQKASTLLQETVKDIQSLGHTAIAQRLADQLFRSASSISANIAEGLGRRTVKEFVRACVIARGEVDECRNWYYQCSSLKLLPDATVSLRNTSLMEIRKMITCFIARLK